MTSELPGPGWTACRIEDIAQVNPESTKGIDSEQSIRYIDISSVGGSSPLDDIPEMPLSSAPSRAKRLVRQGDILVSNVRPERKAFCVVPPALDSQVASTGFTVLRADDAVVEPQFLWAVVQSPAFVDHLVSRQTGTNYPAVRPRDVVEAPLLLPPRSEQRRIAAVLGSLEGKSESNRRLELGLEAAAAIVFSARFVEFVGVERFEESQIGPIPVGWRAGALSELARVTMGQSPPGSSYRETPDEGVLLVQGMGGFGRCYPTSATWTTEPTRLAPSGASLMTVRAPVGAVNVAFSQVCIGRGVAAIHSDHPAFVEFLVRSLQQRWSSEESGTIFPAVNRRQVEGIQVAVPPDDMIASYEAFANPLVRQRRALHREAEHLVALRDLLLPSLISGEIRVPDMADVEEAVGIATEAPVP